MRSKTRVRSERFGALLAVLVALAAVPQLGCADEGAGAADAGEVFDSGSRGEDGAAPATGDAAGIDAGSDRFDSENDDAAGAAACYDFQDADGDMIADCDDSDCAVAPICCIGTSTEGCCVPDPAAAVHDLAGCTGTGTGALATCVPGATLFGSPSPELRLGAMIPNGTDRYDSGFVLAGSVDPRTARVSVDARIRVVGGCTGCIDHVAVGLVSDNATFDATTRIDADVALVVNGAQREVRLLIGDAIVRAWTFDALATLLGHSVDSVTYTLTAAPDGTIGLSADGTSLDDTGIRWAPAGPARVVAYGRTTNPGATDPQPAALESLTVRSDVCDAPASIARRAASVLPNAIEGFWVSDDLVSGASVVTYTDDGGDHADMAFAFGGRIFHAEGLDDGRFLAVRDPHNEGSALLQPLATAPWAATALSEPELVRGEREWILYFTAIGSDGSPSIGRATGMPGFLWAFGAPELVIGPGYDGPTYVRATIAGVPRELLAARRHGEQTEIVLLDMAGEAAAPLAGAVLDPAAYGDGTHDFIHRSGRSTTAFDADEISAPALVMYRGVLRLYFAGRRGTRWSIGMLVSGDAQHWRLSNDGLPLLSGSGAGFDAISVSEPDPVIAGDELRLYYTGSDGVHTAIGLGTHLLPAGSAL